MQLRLFALLGCLIFLTPSCKETFFEAEPANDPEAIFEALWGRFQADYGPFSERGVDWNAAYAAFRPQVTATTSEEALYEALTGLLARLDDGHVNLYAPDRAAFNSNRIRRERIGYERFDLDIVLKNYLKNGFETDADTTFVYGLLEPNLLYIHWPYVSGNLRALNQALDKYPDAKGLVVDLRHNDGGDFTWAFSEMGRLTSERRLVFRSRTKNGPNPSDFTPWHDWYLNPKGAHFDRPIVLLTDRYTISAGERMAMAFQTLPNCTTVGDTTAGAQSTMVSSELANGWKYTIATQNTRLHDGRSYEGIGLAPNKVVQNDVALLRAGQDQTLETAMHLLR